MIELISFAFMCAVIGEVYTNILTEPDYIFNRMFIFLDKNLPTLLFKIVIGCERCVTGQLALWSWLIYNWDNYHMVAHMRVHMFFHIMRHIFVVTAAIYLVIIIHFIYSWIKKNR